MEWSDNYKTGVAFFYGNEEVEQNMEEAESLFRSECVKGNILAMEMMGKLLELEDEWKKLMTIIKMTWKEHWK